jgi:hypothetical protein
VRGSLGGQTMTAFWTDVYQQHFQKYFQKPFDIQIYHDETDASLKLATYDLVRNGYRVYASMGLADRLANNDDDNFGEVILFCDVPDAEAPILFVKALFFILQNNIPLDSRFAIGFGDAHGSFAFHRKVAFYFTHATGPDEKFDKVRMGETFGRVFQAYFITREEDAFLEDYGADAFEEEFFKKHGAVLSVRRESCV